MIEGFFFVFFCFSRFEKFRYSTFRVVVENNESYYVAYCVL